VTGRGRTCDAPRFKRALYRLSYGHVNEWAEPGSNRRPPPHQRGALPTELPAVAQRSRVCPAPIKELDAHPDRAGARSRIGSLVRRQRRCQCHSPTLRPWIAGLGRPTWRGVGARCSHGISVSLGMRKVTRTFTREIQRYIVEDLSLSGGASSGVGTFQAEHHLLICSG
jgi:hypothetical protein